jgi:exosortase/archaeosortase family protein
MDIVRRPIGAASAVGFAASAVAASLGLFGLLRLPWTEAHLVLPFTRAQAAMAAGLLGAPALPVAVTLACSGADALALCFGAILAYPEGWRRRLIGAAGGAALIISLNTIRIGTLGRVASSPAWFTALHLYLWPGVLTLAIAGYVFAWMRIADRRQAPDDPGVVGVDAHREPVPVPRWHPSRRFVVLSITFMLLFVAAAPIYLASPLVAAVAGFIARAAAVTLGVIGISAHAAGNVLWTSRGGFLVTQECISTPLLPIYLAAVSAYSTTRRRLFLALSAALPLFIVLGVVRLLVVALPAVVAAPLFFVHAFYQLLLAAVLVFLAARWRHRGSAAIGYGLGGVIVGVLVVRFAGPSYLAVLSLLAGAPPLDDPQGAIALLPAFQVGLYLALWVAAFSAVGWRRFVIGLVVLAVSQTAVWLALAAVSRQFGLTAHVRDVRGWAIVAPMLVLVAVVNYGRPHR